MDKSREDWISWFTSNEEIDGYDVNDDTAELRGYIECVEGTTFCKTTYNDRTELFKFYVNNGKGRRMKDLSWGSNAVKWSPKISERSIVVIERAFVHPANPKWKGPLDSNCLTELEITKESRMTFEDVKFLEELSDTDKNSVPPVVLIKDVYSAENKKIRVFGWIKVPFELVSCGGGSRGSGVIVEHEWKIRVHVRIYQRKEQLTKGMKVYVDCQFNSYEGCVLSCQSIDQITLVAGEKALCIEELNNMGFYTPKRKLDEDSIQPLKKRSPFDESF